MKELKVDLKQIENVVLMKVLEQDESTRGEDELFKASNGFGIFSHCISELSKNIIYVRGTATRSDLLYSCYEFNDAEQASKYIAKVKACIEEYNETIRAKNAEEAKKKERWKPENNRKYIFINAEGYVQTSFWGNCFSDFFRWNEKNCFQTYEEAKRKQEILKFIHERQWFPTQAELEDSSLIKFCIDIHPLKKSCVVLKPLYTASERWYFKTRELAQEVADFVGYDDFIKYL